MIDRRYGHPSRDGREHAIKLLDALNAPELDPWRLVDAPWTPKQNNGVKADNDSPEEHCGSGPSPGFWHPHGHPIECLHPTRSFRHK